MTSEEWQRIKELVQEAMEREACERAELLDRACGDNLELRRQVESKN